MSNWPKHADGRPMKLGEMTQEQRREQWMKAAKRVQAELDHPLMKEKLFALLNQRADH